MTSTATGSNTSTGTDPMTPVSARERSSFGHFQLRPSHLVTGPSPYPRKDPRSDRFYDLDVLDGQSFTDEQALGAARTICGRVRDAEVARDLMQALGVTEGARAAR